MWNNFLKNNKGFSIIEILISSAIFILVMTVAIGSFMSTSNSAKRSKALRVAMDNVNFAMDTITRDLRMGDNYDSGTIGIGSSQINFHPELNSLVPTRYFFLDASDRSVGKCDFAMKPAPGSVCSKLTAPEVKVKKLLFVTHDDDTLGNETQPAVYIEMEGEVDAGNGIIESFSLHTLASQRNAE